MGWDIDRVGNEVSRIGPDEIRAKTSARLDMLRQKGDLAG